MRVLRGVAAVLGGLGLAAVLIVRPGIEPIAVACERSVTTSFDWMGGVSMHGGADCGGGAGGTAASTAGHKSAGAAASRGPSVDELMNKVKAAYASYSGGGATSKADLQSAGQAWLDALGCGETFDSSADYVAANAPCWKGGQQSAPAKPKMSPQQAWSQVKASLHLEGAEPRVGPDYSVHHTRSEVTGKPLDSVVGYPLWFWAEGGDLSSKSSKKSLGGMKVSFTMTPGSVTIDAGDGHSFTCSNLGTKWTPQVEAGAQSPTCGHTYSETGTYTVSMTTHWTVHYVVDDGHGDPLVGDESFSGTKTRKMRIGELQVVVDH